MTTTTNNSQELISEKKRLARFVQETDVKEGTFRHTSRVQVATIAFTYDLDAARFVRFVADRFSYASPGYITEWAERIAAGTHFRYADSRTVESLKEAGYRDDS